MADWKAPAFRRVLASADRRSESAICRGLFKVKTPGARSSALLVRVTSRDHRSIRAGGRRLLPPSSAIYPVAIGELS
jgi:hypothetical protein